ncbi:hypothetical protein [Escherichia coli]|uniref:hypothetical protein n=1 Tax=Escherichia coli TaxID=562 RepID=UPI00388F41EA
MRYRRQPDCRRGTRGAGVYPVDDGPRQARSYQVIGIAVLPVSGTLVSRTRRCSRIRG